MTMKTKHKKISQLDVPETTDNRSRIIKQKYFLYQIYRNNYKRMYNSLTPENRNGYLVELGSGGGFIKEIIPHAITSDILKLKNIDMHFSATKMPFKNKSVNAFMMIDVFHHISDVEIFLKETNRCLKKGGQIIMIEPASTVFGKFIWKNFHHENFDDKTKTWSFLSDGPLSSANSALPWIVFFRDRKKFENKFPDLKIQLVDHHTPIKYLLSGGLSHPQLLPNIFNKPIDLLERGLKPMNSKLGMFYFINIIKQK
jgi:SAM-dependent methyltransferase